MRKCDYRLNHSPCGKDDCCADCKDAPSCSIACHCYCASCPDALNCPDLWHTDPETCPHCIPQKNENLGSERVVKKETDDAASGNTVRRQKRQRSIGIAFLFIGLLAMVAGAILYPLVQIYGTTHTYSYTIPSFVSPYHVTEDEEGNAVYEVLETTLLIYYEDESHLSAQYKCSCSDTSDDPHYIIVIWCGDYVYYTEDLPQLFASSDSGVSTERMYFNGTVYVARADATEEILTSFTIDAEQWSELLYGTDPAENGWYDLESDSNYNL